MWNKLFAITGVLALGLSGYALYAILQQPRIGVVDNAALITNFSEAINARKQFESEKAQWDANSKVMEDSIKATIDEMTKTYPGATKAKRKEMEERLQHWNSEYSRYTKTVKSLAAQKEQDLLAPVVQKVNSFIKNWGAQHRYDIIYGTAGGGVILTVNPKMEITARVLADLNALYGPPKTESSPAGPHNDTVKHDDTSETDAR
jgi:Skp family chaperone for outer membrane proteins